MAAFKLNCERDKQGHVFIRCPKCRIRQELPLTKEWYEIDHRGMVSPIFVCMEKTRTCFFEGELWIVNWEVKAA